ncbi:MAG: 6-bladed beta-propeller [Tannerellaceae bacterium]|jgi:hypothetical protein|nr:6-bladed beta-propeller [Tannerellaceae bacterium]
MKRMLIVCTAFVCLTFSCTPEKDGGLTLFGNLALPREMHPSLSSLFTPNYAITPLETTAECLVGRMDKIKKFRGDYYILSNGRSILRFSNEGKFLASLDRQGPGPEDYHRIEDFDVYQIEDETEIWVSDNRNLKVYDAANGTFKHKIAYPFVIHKFRRLNNAHILLLTGQSDYSLTLTDENGNILSEYLKREIPFLMFRPVQFISHAGGFLYQLGISDSYVSFDPASETFTRGRLSINPSYLSAKRLLDQFDRYGMDFIGEANKGSYISNLSVYRDITWANIRHDAKNYLVKVAPDGVVSTVFSKDSRIANDLFGIDESAFISTVTMCESDNSALLYIEASVVADRESPLMGKDGNPFHCRQDDNPCILEFF